MTFKSVAKKLGYNIADEHVMALVLSGLVDAKYNRQDGGFKDDTLIDGIAYTAALADEMLHLEPTKPPL